MITDLRDLGPLLGQRDPGLILVGPVLSFSTGGYRYFYIAANGSKVYETIGLGYFENEADAESQRANIIAILKSRFTDMQIFASHWEMAHAANTRWPNEETAQALALATLLTEPESDAAARDGSIDDDSHTQVVPGDYGQQLVDEVARKPVDLANEAVPPSALPRVVDERPPAQSLSPQNMSASAPSPPGSANRPDATPQQGYSGRNDDDIAAILMALRPHNQSQSAPKLTAATTSSPLSGDRIVGEQQGHSERKDEAIAAILRALKPPHQSQNAPRLPSTTTRSPLSSDRDLREQQGQSERRGDLLAIMASFSRPDLDQNDVAANSRALGPSKRPQSVQWLKGAPRATLLILICAVGGASALLTWARPPSPTRQPAVTTAPSSIVTRQTGSIKPAQVAAEQETEVSGPTQQIEPAPTAMAPSPPTQHSSTGVSTQAEAARDTGSEHQAMTNGPTQQVEPAPAAMTPSPPIQQSSTGVSTQAEAARDSGSEHQAMTNGPTQQVEPAPAAMTPSPPIQQSSTGASTQAEAARDSGSERQAMTNGPTRQVEPAPAAMAPSPPAPQPSGGLSTQAEAARDSGAEHQVMTTPVPGPQSSPAQGSSTALRVDSQEIATLIDRSTAFLKRGDVASARLLLRRAVEAGSADAALMLGSTFDPLIIQQLGVVGIEPDVARARQWYQKAAELGSDAASQRLANLKNQ